MDRYEKLEAKDNFKNDKDALECAERVKKDGGTLVAYQRVPPDSPDAIEGLKLTIKHK